MTEAASFSILDHLHCQLTIQSLLYFKVDLFDTLEEHLHSIVYYKDHQFLTLLGKTLNWVLMVLQSTNLVIEILKCLDSP